MYIVKLNGEKVRIFNDYYIAKVWADKYCKGNVTIVSLTETHLPRASKLKGSVLFRNYEYAL